MEQKQYSPILDQEYGQKAEEVVYEYLRKRSDIQEVIRFPYGKMDVDLQVIQKAGSNYFVDVERRGNWVWSILTFPFLTIHIPSRKFGMIVDRQPFIYFAVRSDCKRMVSIPGSLIVNSEVKMQKNKYDNARFFDVPVESLFYWDLEQT